MLKRASHFPQSSKLPTPLFPTTTRRQFGHSSADHFFINLPHAVAVCLSHSNMTCLD